VARETDDIVPEREEASAKAAALKPSFESSYLGTLTRAVDSRKTDYYHEMSAPNARGDKCMFNK
jgi:hypothetical protein